MELFHVTNADNLAAIAVVGLKPRTYLASDEDLSDYYAETIEDEGGQPVVLQVSLSDLDEAMLHPDHPGIEEPITTVLGMSEAEIQEAWERSAGTWQDSLELVKSVRYDGSISSEDILVVDESGDTMLLIEYLQKGRA